MNAYNQLGNLAWITGKCKDVKDAYDIYQITQSEDALLNVAAKVGELVGIGIPLWYADKVLTKTGLDRVFDSLKTNKNFEQYLLDQRATTNIRGLCLGTLAEWGLREFSEWLSKGGLLDPLFESISGNFSLTQPNTPNDNTYRVVRYDPLVLDLDGDGIETISGSRDSGVLFDQNGDGIRTTSGWINSDDGLLVRDINANGSIDSGAELFGDRTLLRNGAVAANGFAALADLDSNLDGQVNDQDTAFNELRVWQDVNQDGVTDSGELLTLEALGVSSLNTLVNDTPNTALAGGILAETGSFTRPDGSTGTLADVNFTEDTFQSSYTTQIDIPAELQNLPNITGMGRLRDLREAAVLSPALADALSRFNAAATRTARKTLLDEVLLEWAKTDPLYSENPIVLYDKWTYQMEYSETSTNIIYLRPGQALPAWLNPQISDPLAENYADQMLLHRVRVLDAIRGNAPTTMLFELLTGQATAANRTYEAISKTIYSNLLMQTRLKPYLDAIDLVIDENGIRIDFTPVQELFNTRYAQDHNATLSDLAELFMNIDPELREASWQDGLPTLRDWVLTAQQSGDPDTLAMLQDMQIIAGSGNLEGTNEDNLIFAKETADVINAGYGDDIVYGEAGDDTLNGLGGNDKLDGGTGSDTMSGGLGDDTFIVDVATDLVTENANEGIDTIQSGATYTLGANVENLVLTGSTAINGTGNDLSNTITGNTANNVLNGGAGNDTYVFNRGDGADNIYDGKYSKGYYLNTWVNDNYSGGSNDTIRFGAGISAADLKVCTTATDLIIALRDQNNPEAAITNLSDRITIEDFKNYGNRIENFTFADGSTMSISQIITLMVTEGDDVINLWESRTGVLLNGGAGNDTLTTMEGADTVYGDTGNDTINSGAGNDTVYGGDGNDTINSGDGDDVVYGETGNDTITTGSSGNKTISGGDGDDRITTGNGNDVMTGDSGNDTLISSDGTDTLTGGTGNDRLEGYADNDTYVFNQGDGADNIYDGRYSKGYYLNTWVNDNYSGGSNDTIRFGAGISAADLKVCTTATDLIIALRDQNNPEAAITNLSDRITIEDFKNYGNRIENFTFADGSTMSISQIITLMVTEGDDVINLWESRTGVLLNGGAGNDALTTLEGADTVYGGTGNDTINSGAGNDTVYGGDGNDIINSGDGDDVVYGETGNDTITTGSSGNKTISGGDGDDRITTGNGNDLMTGDSGNDTLISSDGTDTLTGGTGNDRLEGYADNDTYVFNRGDGADNIYDGRYSKGYYLNTWVSDNYSGGSNDTIRFGAGISATDLKVCTTATDLIIALRDPNNPEAAITDLPDRITIEDFKNYGNRIENFVFADGSTMSISQIITLMVTEGDDVINLWESRTGVLLNGGAGNDTLTTLEGADTVYGDTGNDTINSGAGNDTVYGGDGNDIINSGDGDDVVYGETGNDTITTGSSGNKTISGGDGDDRITTGNGNDVMTGDSGNDTLISSDGTDTLTGGTGNDRLEGYADNDTYVFNQGDGADNIYDGKYSKGYYLNTWVNDNYSGGSNDTIRFGAGISAADLKVCTTATDLIIALRDPNNPEAAITALPDRITIEDFKNYGNRIENFTFADGSAMSISQIITLMVTEGDDVINLWESRTGVLLNGGAGNDTLTTLEGADTVYGDTGNDTINSGAGNDTVYGGDGIDIINSGDGDDVVYGETGNDTITTGSSGNKTISGGDGDDRITTGNGNDVMTGDSGNDTLTSSDGADTLTGGTGNDRLEGYADNDTYVFNQGDGADNIYDGKYSKGYYLNTWVNDNYSGGSNDTIRFGAGISAADLKVCTTATDLIIALRDQNNPEAAITNLSDRITIEDFKNYGNRIENFTFADGSTMSISQIITLMVTEGDDVINLWESRTGVLLNGGAGNDTLTTLEGADTVYGDTGNDTINSGAGNDTVYGGDGNDIINSGDGDDVVYGETGNDTITTGSSGNKTISGGDGDDRITTGNGNDVMTGDSGNDTLISSDGTDTLTGGTGNDRLEGYADNDTYVFNQGDGADNIYDGRYSKGYYLNTWVNDNYSGGSNDTIRFGAGITATDLKVCTTATDLIIALRDPNNPEAAITDLPDRITIEDFKNYGNRIENFAFSDGMSLNFSQLTELIATEGDDTITMPTNLAGGTLRGWGGNDTLTGGAGNDLLDGGAGLDTMLGGPGNDSYVVDNPGDLVSENAGEGTDTVLSSVTCTLGSNIENLLLTGSSAIDGAGNDLANIITGNSANNMISTGDGDDLASGAEGDDIINAGAGVDTLDGGLGNDLLTGGANEDTLSGGPGADRLEGDAGNDTYVFNRGDGSDAIYDGQFAKGQANNTIADDFYAGGTDTIRFGAGITVADLKVSQTESDLVIGLRDPDNPDTAITDLPDRITIEDFSNFGNRIENFVFNEGQSLGIEQIIALIVPDRDADRTLSGADGHDTLSGGSGNDLLDGGAGCDTMAGGAGNDTYVVDTTMDQVTENAGEGLDTVQSSVVYTLGANVENLVLAGTATINGSGNDLDNTITGNSANNTLDGGTGADTLSGGLGNDTYIVDDLGDVVTELAGEGTDRVNSAVDYTLGPDLEYLTLTGTAAINGTGNQANNIITGNSGDNTLIGLGGNDTINGGAGADTMLGGEGNDTYTMDNAQDLALENANEGTDMVQSSVSYTLGQNLENLTLTGTAAINGIGNEANNYLTGNSAANILTGGPGNDSLNGGAGADTMSGGLGNDTYTVDSLEDMVHENANEGTDTLQSYITCILGENFEHLQLIGTAAVNGTGNDGHNYLIGNSAANILTGGLGNDSFNGAAGADTMFGGPGNDTYMVDNTGDVVTENPGEGTDTILPSISWTLTEANVENLTLTGTAAINATGDEADNVITGNTAANILSGLGGNDTLNGGAGNDTYYFSLGDGTDTINNNDPSGLDTVAFGSGIERDSIALFRNGNNLEIGYGGSDTVSVNNFFSTPNSTVDNVNLAGGSYLTAADLNRIIQDMAAFAVNEGIALNSIDDVRNNQQLMTLVVDSWHP